MDSQIAHSGLESDYLKDLTHSDPTFSLVTYRNDLYTSSNPKVVAEFFDSFQNADQLVRWMKERPREATEIREVDGNKGIVVVIPTASYDSKYAEHCRNDIFPGLQVIFVISRGPFFNMAHSVNVGTKEAMKYDPDWIIFSSDDMVKIDDVKILEEELSELKSGKTSCVFTNKSTYHSYTCTISRFNNLGNIASRMRASLLQDKNQRNIWELRKKFDIKNVFQWNNGTNKLFTSQKRSFTHIGSFAIVSGGFIKKNNGALFDETFINGGEDVDLSLRLDSLNNKCAFINYSIGDIVGGSLGTSFARTLREQASNTYLSHLIESRKVLG